ncbi:MAG: FGGY-family carbohydrate kinase [Planctomycetota bacterium]|jgi:sugar (pentulose or hexulose) kinase
MMILGVDIGTTGMKMGMFRIADDMLNLVRQFSQEYEVNIYNDGLFGDIEQDKWKRAFAAGCKDMEDLIADVDVISLSGTTPGLTAMDKDGQALYPAILMLDQRSRKQAKFIIETVGMEHLLKTTANMPVAGGCSLASILWIKDNCPEIFGKTHMFGHSNTYIAHWLTGTFAIDPSSASLTALYNTVGNDLAWNEDIAVTFGLSLNQLPQIVPAYESLGRISQSLAQELGFRKEPPVLIGGNDAVLAAYSVGINEPGDIINVNGTCEINLVCLGKCLASANYNIELSTEEFYNGLLPQAIETWLDCESGVTYVPYLMGSRYSQEPLKAQLLGLTQQTTREEILAGIVRGLCEYQKAHLDEIGENVPLQDVIHVTGGATNPALMRAKSKWMRDCEYVYNEQSSLKGAAMLALYLSGSGPENHVSN